MKKKLKNANWFYVGRTLITLITFIIMLHLAIPGFDIFVQNYLEMKDKAAFLVDMLDLWIILGFVTVGCASYFLRDLGKRLVDNWLLAMFSTGIAVLDIMAFGANILWVAIPWWIIFFGLKVLENLLHKPAIQTA